MYGELRIGQGQAVPSNKANSDFQYDDVNKTRKSIPRFNLKEEYEKRIMSSTEVTNPLGAAPIKDNLIQQEQIKGFGGYPKEMFDDYKIQENRVYNKFGRELKLRKNGKYRLSYLKKKYDLTLDQLVKLGKH
jgi:hypothetical protein